MRHVESFLRFWSRLRPWALLILAVVFVLASSRVSAALGVMAAAGLAIVLLVILWVGFYLSNVTGRRSQFESDRVLRQVEALLSIHSTLPVRRPLPSFRPWAISADIGAHLVDEILAHRPRLVVELGSGVSTILSAYALEMIGEGKIISLESDEDFGKVTASRLREHGLERWVTLCCAPLREYDLNGVMHKWYDLSGIPTEIPIDLLFVDGPPRRTQAEARYPALPLLASRLSPRARIILDDARRPDEAAILARWAKEYPEFKATLLEHEKGTALLVRTGERTITQASA